MIQCDLCDATVADVGEAIREDWNSEYYVFGECHGSGNPICSRCVETKCHISDDGEVELITDDPAQIVNAVRSTSIRSTICDYLRGKSTPSMHDLRCFVGMVESGEASQSDFVFVGGDALWRQVCQRNSQLVSERIGVTL